MTGLDLESFLKLLRADWGAWASLGLVAAVLALMTWTSWGSRRALRKCLVLSVATHVGLLLYMSTFPIVMALLRDKPAEAEESVRIQLAPTPGAIPPEGSDPRGLDGRTARAVALWDRVGDAPTLADPSASSRPSPRGDAPAAPLDPTGPSPRGLAPEAVVLEINPPRPTAPANGPAAPAAAPAPAVAPGDPTEVAGAVATRPADPASEAIVPGGRARPERPAEPDPRPAEPGRPAPPTPSLVAAPSPAPPAPAGPSGTPAVARPAGPDSPIALGDPSDVAAPRLGPRNPDPSPGETGPLAKESDVRARARRESTTPGVSPMIALAPRPPAPLAASSTTVATIPSTPTAPRRPAPGPLVYREAGPTSAAPEPTPGPVAARLPVTPAPGESLPETDARRLSRPGRPAGPLAQADRPDPGRTGPLPRVAPSGAPALPAIAGAGGLTRPPSDVPLVYRSRLDPNRFALAQRSGASRESEQAVERALEWLRAHQDPDGRWDGGTAKYKDGTVAGGDDDYTVFCPAGDICFGECYYWEADTALTGLALLAYLGSGYTHVDGQYTDTVARGLEYLRQVQKPDGDLRGRSQAVGMYCHSMATLALCEAYALTGDPKLRGPVERAVAFLVKSRASDGLAWRYAPGAPVGDTSILGWVVMVLKSAQEAGIPTPAATKQGILTWLGKVAAGNANGLAMYQPWEKVTPTMTAEAWVCRQFLGVGGPGPSSTEAAEYLLRNATDRPPFNLYYIYYGTLSMYQQGGDSWSRWNAVTRDQILRRQRAKGHAAGSWDPDESPYGSHGGRIYCTALATLSLEVYYRYLRLYDAPATTPTPDPRPLGSAPRRTADLFSEPIVPR